MSLKGHRTSLFVICGIAAIVFYLLYPPARGRVCENPNDTDWPALLQGIAAVITALSLVLGALSGPKPPAEPAASISPKRAGTQWYHEVPRDSDADDIIYVSIKTRDRFGRATWTDITCRPGKG